MKFFQHIVLVLLFVNLVACSETGRVIDYPVVEKTNTNALELYRVEVSDTATILQMALYNRPGEFALLSSEVSLMGKTTGKTYRLTNVSGCELGKKIIMPASGCCWVTLQFEPVSPKDKFIDFISLKDNWDLRLEGIHLKPIEQPRNTFECVLEGEVKDWPECSRLLLTEACKQDVARQYSIPVVDGKFRYTLRDSVNRLYQLCSWHDYMNNGFYPVDFISEKGKTHFKLYNGDAVETSGIQSDSPLNKELQHVKEGSIMDPLFSKRRQLMQDKQYYLSEIHALKDRVDQESDESIREQLMEDGRAYFEKGDGMTEQARSLEKEINESFQKEKERNIAYIRTYPTLVGLCLYKYWLFREIGIFKSQPSLSNIPMFEEIFENLYKEQYASHPYIKEIGNNLAGLQLKKGDPFVDFVAPDVEGNSHRLSDLIQGKYALLDLWSSWCSPCRAYSKLIIPTYETYKDKGFTVVGVAREANSTGPLEKALQQDQYPWINLVDLNGQVGVWEMYGETGAGGRFLIDPEGQILALDPLPEQVEKLLKEHIQ